MCPCCNGSAYLAWSRAILAGQQPGRQHAGAASRRSSVDNLGFLGSFDHGHGDVGNHRLRIALNRIRRADGAGRNGRRPGHAEDAGDRRRHPGGRAGLSHPPVFHHRHCRRRDLRHRRAAAGLAGRAGLPDRRRSVGLSRFHRHAGVGARQPAHRAGRDPLAGRGPLHGVPRRRRHRPPGGGPGAARRRRLLLHSHRRHGSAADQPDRGRFHGGAGLRRLADLDLRPSRRRHLHQGCRCRRRSRRQGRGRDPRGRSTQSGNDRRQRRRQRRRLRRHGRRPVRDLRGDRRRHHGAGRDLLHRPADRLQPDALPACRVRGRRGDLDHRHVLRPPRRQPVDHGRALQGLHRHRRAVDHRPVAGHRLPARHGHRVLRTRGKLHGHGPLLVRHRRPGRHRAPHRRHGILYGHELPPRALDRRGVEDRPRHQRHPGPCRVARGDRAAGADHRGRHHRLLQHRGAVRHCHCRHRHAVAGRRGGGARRLRAGDRQRRRHCRDGGAARGDPQDHGRAGCGR